MDVMEAIYQRRAVRAYADQPIEKTTVEALIKAAIHAPSSMNEQPWAFAMIQNPQQLALRSGRIKADVLRRLKPDSPLVKYRDMLLSPDYTSSIGRGRSSSSARGRTRITAQKTVPWRRRI